VTTFCSDGVPTLLGRHGKRAKNGFGDKGRIFIAQIVLQTNNPPVGD
jgi:hypothetical protein